MESSSIYIHIPFCMKKCAYCDFLSFSGMENHFDGYVNALCEEIKKVSAELTGYKTTTIFFGGGTPSLLPAELLNKILAAVKNNHNVDKNTEITIEANPETVDCEKLYKFRQIGFNRISFGVQAWQDSLLKTIGRVHNAEKAEQAVLNAKKAGFGNINIDLMFALPGQSIPDWEESLQKTVALEPEHISCYSLILEEGTRLFSDNGIVLPDDETDREMYYKAKKYLKDAGYRHYEISNFAKPGMESRHNTVYWTGGDYIGYGLGAHSLIRGNRFHNTADFRKYMSIGTGRKSGHPKGGFFAKRKSTEEFEKEDNEALSVNDKQSEFMILGLRLLDGVSGDVFFKRFGATLDDVYGKELEESTKQGLLAQNGGRFFLTERGIDLSNQVFIKFL